MSNEICHRDRRKISQILEQIEVLSNVVDELRAEINDLKKIFPGVNDQNVLLESTREDKVVYHIEPSLLRKVETSLRSTEAKRYSAKLEGPCQFARNVQVCKYHSASSDVNYFKTREHKRLAVRLSGIYQDFKCLKNKIIRNIQGIRKIQRSSKIGQDVDQQQVSSSQEEATQESYKSFDPLRNADATTIKHTEIGKDLHNSSHVSFLLDASTQTFIISRQDYDEESSSCDPVLCKTLTENSVQVSPLASATSSDRLATIRSDRSIYRSFKNRVKRTSLLTKKVKQYKKCSCGKQCPYALYKLPCKRYKCDTPERKVKGKDEKINELTLECVNCKEKNNFPKFISIDTVHGKADERPAEFLSLEIGKDRFSASSLSIDLEVDICGNRCHLENEVPNRERTRKHILKKRSSRKKGKLAKPASTEDETSLNAISSQRNVAVEREKIDEATKALLLQRRYAIPENRQEYQAFVRKNFAGSHRSRKNDTKQMQCAISAATAVHEKVSVKTSTPDFHTQENSVEDQSYKKTSKVRCARFTKEISTNKDKL